MSEATWELKGVTYKNWFISLNKEKSRLELSEPIKNSHRIWTAVISNKIDVEDINWVLVHYCSEFAKSINCYVSFLLWHYGHYISSSRIGWNDNMKESYSAIFCSSLIKEIAFRAEMRMEKRVDGMPSL